MHLGVVGDFHLFPDLPCTTRTVSLLEMPPVPPSLSMVLCFSPGALRRPGRGAER